MKRLLAGTFVGGLVLAACAMAPWASPVGPSLFGCLLAGFLATLLLEQLGPRSLVEKVLFLLTAGTLAWAGRAPWDMTGGALLEALVAWSFAGAALAWLTRPRAE
ncbi:MAG: hypothetical protein SF051_09985 [Elusimicrobiota bacterium]|nr:hypothetical protein [Elusimicrobiota bacterium]